MSSFSFHQQFTVKAFVGSCLKNNSAFHLFIGNLNWARFYQIVDLILLGVKKIEHAR